MPGIKQKGGTVDNTGTITGTTYGVYIYGAAGTVTNSGTITATASNGFGVELSAGGSVENSVGATIGCDSAAVYIKGGIGEVANSGAIFGRASHGATGAVEFLDGGTVINSTGGKIGSDTASDGPFSAGVSIAGGAGTISNGGTIKGLNFSDSRAFGIALLAGGTVTNTNGGVIYGYDRGRYSSVAAGVYMDNGYGSVTNSGAIVAKADDRSDHSLAVGVLFAKVSGIVTNSGVINAIAPVGGFSSAWGVSMSEGGTIINKARAVIDEGVFVGGAYGIVRNSGKIIKGFGHDGIELSTGGSVIDNSGAKVASGEYGILISGGKGTVTNGGYVVSYSTYGVGLFDGGTVTNSSSGTIDGVIVLGGGAVTNAGVIKGGGLLGTAVSLSNGGTLTNQVGGSIVGSYYGVMMGGDAETVTNAGAISGTKAAIDFGGSGVNTLILQTGSVLIGAVDGSTFQGATNVLTLQGSGGASNTFLNFDTLSVQASGRWTLGGNSIIGATTVSTGKLLISGVLATAINSSVASIVKIVHGGELALTGASILSGAFAAVSGAVIDVEVGPLVLKGDVVFAGGELIGAQKTKVRATTTVRGLLLASAGPFANLGTLTQSGEVVVGDAAGDAIPLYNQSAATWDITGGSISLSSPSNSYIANSGLFEMTGGGVSHIAPAFANTGATLVSSGTLDFQATLTGTGTDTISGAATLEFDSTVASAQTIYFVGGGGILDVGSPTGFFGVLSGFDSVGSNDAVELLGAWSISGFSTTASQSTLTLTNGNQTASLLFDGSYNKAAFDANIGSGHTTITYI